MENLNVAVSLTRTDYGSTTLKSAHTSAYNARSSTSVSSIYNTTNPASTNIAASDCYQSLPYTSSTNLFSRSPKYIRAPMSSSRFGKMGMNGSLTEGTGEKADFMQRVEIFVGVLNQMCIGFVTIYMSWLCLRMGLSGTALHAWLVTIGFSFLMAEAIMCHYSANVLTFSYKRTTKTTIHWVLQVLGGGCGVAGVLIKCIQKNFILQSTHSKLGFSTFIFCLVTMLSGLAALFPLRIKRLINPLLNKTVHNLLGVTTFVLALLAQFYGYQTGFFSRRADTDFQILMKCLTLITLVLSSIGPMKALLLKISNVVKQFA